MTPQEHLAQAEKCLVIGTELLDNLVKLYPRGVAPEIEARTTYAGAAVMAQIAEAHVNAGKLALMIGEFGDDQEPVRSSDPA